MFNLNELLKNMIDKMIATNIPMLPDRKTVEASSLDEIPVKFLILDLVLAKIATLGIGVWTQKKQ